MSRVFASAAVLLVIIGYAQAQVAGQGSSAQANLGARFTGLGCAGVGVVRYKSTSSPLGLGALANGANTGTDFALSDIPSSPCGGAAANIINVPYGIGLLSVHAKPGSIAGGLRLNACTLQGIYRCSTKAWNAAGLVALNKNLATVKQAIKPIARREVSGSTFVFTNYLGKGCPALWKFQSLTLMSNAPLLKPCFLSAFIIKATGTGGVATAFAANPGALAYLSADRIKTNEVLLGSTTGGKFFLSANVNSQALVTGLNYGTPTCSLSLDVTGKGANFPLAYVAFFMVNRVRRGRPNPKSVKALCSCLALATTQAKLFAGLTNQDFKAAPTAMQAQARTRCGLIVTA